MRQEGLELDMRCHSGPALDVQHSASLSLGGTYLVCHLSQRN